MLRSMYAAISGLKNFQTQLDVIGNNLSNVNTTGFKKGTVNFQDIISQEMSGASAPTFNSGGINPVQVGLGSKIGSIDNDDTQGNLESTGRSLDLAVSGNGYFVVQDGFNQLYTRAGNFYLDANGDLVTSGGQRVMGYGVDPKSGAIDTSKITPLSINDKAVLQPATSSLSFTGNIDDATKMINNPTYKSSAIPFKAFDSNQNSYDGSITFSNPAPAVDQSTGNSYVKSLDFTISINGKTQSGIMNLDSKGAETSFTLTSDPMTFNVGTGTNITINSKDLDLSTLSVQPKVPADAQAVGDVAQLESFNIGSDGKINAVLTNGSVQTLGQLVLANFNNPGGLQKEGDSLFSSTSNSGTAQTGAAGQNGNGSLQAGTLEMSNVDLSQEMTDMIEAQRGFQANAKTITTADQILQTLINLKQ